MIKSIKRRDTCNDFPLPENLHPLLADVYHRRELDHADDLQLSLSKLIPPQNMKGMDSAIALLYTHLQSQSRMLIVSDFDADGATSCALLKKSLEAFGYKHVDFIVPNRFDYGYGLTPEIVELAQTKSPDVIITVDNGISSIEGVSKAKSAGIDVLVTDHHLPGRELPDADAIVNPNQVGCDFTSKCIAGVGVIFYVMLALRSYLRGQDWFVSAGIPEPNMADFLDLVALGTVADVVKLDRNNRILVNEGIRRIRAGKMSFGIAAILSLAGKNHQTLVATDLGFAVGPRLNAAGRLDDMSLGIACLLSDNPGEAHQMALQLDSLNKDRKQIEADMKSQAFSDLSELLPGTEEAPAALCLFKEDWHQGVVGILASRVKDKYHRPVIVFAKSNLINDGDNTEDFEIKGSARSIQGLHIRDVLDRVATENPGLISKFGGHAMAAGLSINHKQLPDFNTAFVKVCEQELSHESLQAVLLSDGEVSVDQLSLNTAEQLQNAGPWGQGFSEPLFDGVFRLLQSRIVGGSHLKMLLAATSQIEDGAIIDTETVVDGIAFNVDLEALPVEGDNIRLAFRMDVNEFRGNRNLQLLVEHIELVDSSLH